MDRSSEDPITIEVQPINPADKIYEKSFREVDRDHNGWLDKKEFREFMIKAKLEHISKYIFKMIDKDGNGKVSLEEFQAYGRVAWACAADNNFEPYMRMIFESVDKGAKGYLTKKEFI